MKKSVRVFSIYALVPLLTAGFCAGFVWRDKRQHENDKALIDAIKARDTSAVIAALKRGADPNARDMPDDTRTLKERFLDLLHHTRPQSERYFTALSYAVETNSPNFSRVKALLDANANPNAIVIDAYPPLNYAEWKGDCTIAHLLLEHHADIHAKDGDGNTPLFEAAGYDNSEEIAFLLQHGASIEEENAAGDCSLFRAADSGAVSSVKYLIEHGADINHRDKKGYTALGDARIEGYPDVVKLLRKAGAVE